MCFFLGGGGGQPFWVVPRGCECYRDGPERKEVFFFRNLRAKQVVQWSCSLNFAMENLNKMMEKKKLTFPHQLVL